MPHSVEARWLPAIASAVVVGLALVGHPVLSQEQESPGSAEDQPASEQRLVRVTQFLDVPVHAEEGDALGVTEDLLIGTDGRFNALVVRALEPLEVRWQIPWVIARPDVSLAQVMVGVTGPETDRLDVYYGPVAGTLGTPDSVLASKLLEANVTDGLGNTLGRVIDLRVDMLGQVHTVLFGSPRQLSDVVEGQADLGAPTLMAVPWTSVTVREESPRDIAPAAGTASEREAVIVVTGEGMQEEEPTEGADGAFIR